ncbi:MAG: hypothetical protein U0527_13705 [Candidatus Eisenbacteria bacterium]
MGQFDLQLRLSRPRTLRKDVEDQLTSIDHPDLQELLQIAHLGGTQVLVGEEKVGLVYLEKSLRFLELPLAEEVAGMNRDASLMQSADRGEAGGVCEQLELIERVVLVPLRLKSDQQTTRRSRLRSFEVLRDALLLSRSWCRRIVTASERRFEVRRCYSRSPHQPMAR